MWILGLLAGRMMKGCHWHPAPQDAKGAFPSSAEGSRKGVYVWSICEAGAESLSGSLGYLALLTLCLSLWWEHSFASLIPQKLGTVSKIFWLKVEAEWRKTWFICFHSAYQALTGKSVQGFDFPNSLHIVAWVFCHLVLELHSPVDPRNTAAILRFTLATLITTAEKSDLFTGRWSAQRHFIFPSLNLFCLLLILCNLNQGFCPIVFYPALNCDKLKALSCCWAFLLLLASRGCHLNNFREVWIEEGINDWCPGSLLGWEMTCLALQLLPCPDTQSQRKPWLVSACEVRARNHWRMPGWKRGIEEGENQGKSLPFMCASVKHPQFPV